MTVCQVLESKRAVQKRKQPNILGTEKRDWRLDRQSRPRACWSALHFHVLDPFLLRNSSTIADQKIQKDVHKVACLLDSMISRATEDQDSLLTPPDDLSRRKMAQILRHFHEHGVLALE